MYLFKDSRIFLLVILSFYSGSFCFAREGDTGAVEESENYEASTPVDETAELNFTEGSRRQGKAGMYQIMNASLTQYPYVVALMGPQGHLCSGVIVADNMVLTSAKCLDKSISYVLVNATKAEESNDTIKRNVLKMERQPDYLKEDEHLHVGLVYIEKLNLNSTSSIRPLNISRFNNQKDVNDFVALGYGLNTESDQPKQFQSVGLEARSTIQDIPIEAHIDCIDSDTSLCFKDSGGPAITKGELIGVITKGEEECSKSMCSAYAVNKHMATVVPSYMFRAWVIDSMEESKLSSRRQFAKMSLHGKSLGESLSSTNMKFILSSIIIVLVFITNIF